MGHYSTLWISSDLDRTTGEMDENDPNYIPDGSDGVYIVFLIIGIIGYFTVPTVAGWMIQSGGMGSTSGAVNKAGTMAAGVAGGAVGNVAGRFMGR